MNMLWRCRRSSSIRWFSQTVQAKKAGGSRQTIVTARKDDFSQWYRDVIDAADLIDAAPVRGCMILKPHGYAIWELLQQQLDRRIKDTGAQNVYFPLLLPQSYLAREAEHVEGFAKECAVVTHHRLRQKRGEAAELEPDPDAELSEPLIVRPTSETLFWSAFKKWIHSHNDLPQLINQWVNVFRWEMRPRPFLRNSEFLWQEGHTAHETKREAQERAHQMLEVYRQFCTDVLAIPMVAGEKSSSEKFSGAVSTYTIEAMLQNGWALQSGTSHFLGQNFGKAFDVTFLDKTGKSNYPWATSWGVSTRLIGALIMTHSDDIGLILPPKVAPIQIVVVPVVRKSDDEWKDKIESEAFRITDLLKKSGYRVHLDGRVQIKPGNRYFEWERKGVPLRIELGRKELENGKLCFKARNESERAFSDATLSTSELSSLVQSKLSNIHNTLHDAAERRVQSLCWQPESYEEVVQHVKDDDERTENTQFGFIEVPWFDDESNEANIKEETKLTLRCFPFGKQHHAKGRTCFYSKQPATNIAIFARSY